MQIRAMVATGNVDTDKEFFSPEALENMIEQASGKPIKIGWKHDIGHIESAEIIDGDVYVSGIIDINLEGLENQELYLVPGFTIEMDDDDFDGDVRVIKHCKLQCLGLTNSPADQNLTPIEVPDAD